MRFKHIANRLDPRFFKTVVDEWKGKPGKEAPSSIGPGA